MLDLVEVISCILVHFVDGRYLKIIQVHSLYVNEPTFHIFHVQMHFLNVYTLVKRQTQQVRFKSHMSNICFSAQRSMMASN